MKKVISTLKKLLRWGILGGILFFLIKTLTDHFSEVTAVRITPQGWLMLGIAATVTFLAHIWSGWVWSWILKMFKQPVQPTWAIQVYLKTNIAKYLPGNFWHFYGRIWAVNKIGGSIGAASLSVLLEPLLMAAAALLVALVSHQLGLIKTEHNYNILVLQVLGLGLVLLGIHPLILNPVMDWLSRLKNKTTENPSVKLDQYPLIPLLGELGFLGLRGMGFILTLTALMTVNGSDIPQLMSVFSFAWLLGLIVPGAPGGLGIFEATIISLLDPKQFPIAIILTTVALYRVISILAEVMGAGLATLSSLKLNLRQQGTGNREQ
ncbi:conserved hypothetical protein [Gloeothece citriformis PCC 7424]|uniref:Uncharacterized protein n=1 Tax=Gloeothece citriformis (strain PCC 7424) TaxID=65393 RepID=B7K808_GLOC7|nr:YbhN family protein [Gloeothece citriformis]ACK68496.1 conserved hypothetical protein [Gloeothece citriformis PCC 7424]